MSFKTFVFLIKYYSLVISLKLIIQIIYSLAEQVANKNGRFFTTTDGSLINRLVPSQPRNTCKNASVFGHTPRFRKHFRLRSESFGSLRTPQLTGPKCERESDAHRGRARQGPRSAQLAPPPFTSFQCSAPVVVTVYFFYH